MSKYGWWIHGAALLVSGAINLAVNFEAAAGFAMAFPWKELREWISALAGYFALFAAWLTVKEMAKQRRESNRHQRENVELQILPRVALARSIADMSGNVADSIPLVCELLAKVEAVQTPAEVKGAALRAVKVVSQVLPEIDLGLIQIYGRETASGRTRVHRFLPQFVAAARSALAHLNTAIQQNDVSRMREEAQKLSSSVGGLANYFGPLRDEASAFCQKWQARADPEL